MNLIDKLGGYEETKKHLDSCWCDDDNRAYLLEKLLEHRRQHNIFEVGDVMVIPSRGNGIFHFNALFSDSDIAEARHASPEEIKAGCRL